MSYLRLGPWALKFCLLHFFFFFLFLVIGSVLAGVSIFGWVVGRWSCTSVCAFNF